MRRATYLAGLYLFLVFASGVVVGAFGYRYMTKSVGATGPRTPEEYRNHYVSEMRTRLKLSPDQVTRLNSILDATREEYRAFRLKYKPEMQAIQDEQVRRINGILSHDQRAEYDKMREERERNRRNQGK